jgi:hypothetical protein
LGWWKDEIEIMALDIEAIEQTRHDFRLQFHQEQWVTFENITALLEEVRRCWIGADYRRVQQHLGKHIERVDAAADAAHENSRNAFNRLRRLRQRKIPPDPGEVTRLEAEYKHASFDHELYLRLGHQYRMVGDAIAWQHYNFQSLPIYALGMNQSPGPHTSFKKVGTDVEEKTVDKLWNEHGAFALRHDYTNCLRVWDLSVLYPDFSKEIVEEKVEGREVTSQQQRKGERSAKLITHNECITPDGHSLFHRSHSTQSSDKVVRTNLTLLQGAIVQAAEEGIGYASHSYLTVAVVNVTKLATTSISNQAMYKKLIEIRDMLPAWEPNCTDILSGYSYHRKARSSLLVPYTIYPIPSDCASALVTGYFRAHFQLNTAAITQALNDAGFEVECLLGKWRTQGTPMPKKPKAPYFRVHKGAMTMNVHDLSIEQMLFEGLPLEDFVASVVADYKTLVAQKDSIASTCACGNPQHFQTISTFTCLEDVWYASREYVT